MRLTLDIDGRNRGWWAWGVYYMLRDSGEFRRVELWKTRRGYHVVAYGGVYAPWELQNLRRSLGDDPLRVEIDSVKHPLQPAQVLWTVKNGWTVTLLESWECGK